MTQNWKKWKDEDFKVIPLNGAMNKWREVEASKRTFHHREGLVPIWDIARKSTLVASSLILNEFKARFESLKSLMLHSSKLGSLVYFNLEIKIN